MESGGERAVNKSLHKSDVLTFLTFFFGTDIDLLCNNVRSSGSHSHGVCKTKADILVNYPSTDSKGSRLIAMRIRHCDFHASFAPTQPICMLTGVKA